MIQARPLQHFLKKNGYYKGNIDGAFGPKSKAAAVAMLVDHGQSNAVRWQKERVYIALMQLLFVKMGIDPGKTIEVDGIYGPVSQYALELWQNRVRDCEEVAELVEHQPEKWPRQSDVQRFYGDPGKNLTLLNTPYPLYLDWDETVKVTRFSIHEKCADSAERVMKRVLDHYGEDEIHRLGLDQFGGCYNYRKMRGGSRLSMHSWGIAIDWDANRNQLRWGRDKANLATVQCAKFLDLWQEEGWISLGRERNYDWMHVQAARL